MADEREKPYAATGHAHRPPRGAWEALELKYKLTGQEILSPKKASTYKILCGGLRGQRRLRT